MEDKLEKLKKKNDLSDIILEKEGNSGENMKKILLGIASLILLFLIGLILMKMFNNSEISPSENLASIGEEVKDSGNNIMESINDTAEGTLFKEEPIIDEVTDTDLKFEEMVRRLKQEDSGIPDEKPTAQNDLTKVADTANTNILDKIKDTTGSLTKQAVEKVEQTAQSIKPQVETRVIEQKPATTYVQPIVNTQPKRVYIEEVPTQIRQVQTSTEASSYPISTTNGYFIQVGATYNSFPTRGFLNKIKNSGYDYIVHKVNIKGRIVKKVLVGPYVTRDQARNDLSDVQTKINPSAYIYRIR